MPIYEYECVECGHRVEEIQKVSDSPLKKCQKCEGKVERLVSSPAIQFKGTGWYKTDYAGKDSGASNDGKKAPAEEKSGADTSASASKDSESKKPSKDSSDSSSKKASSEKAA